MDAYDQFGALEVTLLSPAEWLVEQQQSTALLAILAELQDSKAVDQEPSGAAPLQGRFPERLFVSFVPFVVQTASRLPFLSGTDQILDSLDHVLEVAPSAGRLGAQGLTSGALDIVRESLVSSLVEGVESDLAWQDQVATVLDGSAAGSLIWLEMPELVAVGLATVKSIEPCPPIKSGPGRIVTATFRHASAEVLDLTFAPNLHSSSSLTAHTSTLTTDPSSLTLGVTAAHPFWSVDRECFVPAGELQPQEQVIGIDGQYFRLTSITPRAGPETVYNLEVALDHVYYVGEGGVLVHNSCSALTDLALGLGKHMKSFQATLAVAKEPIKALDYRIAMDMIAHVGDDAWTGVRAVMSKADNIRFNLEGLDPKQFAAYMKGNWKDHHPHMGGTNWTNRELAEILANDDLLKKTIFYNGDISDFRLFFEQ